MNKPFTLEEYKKDPSRLCDIRGVKPFKSVELHGNLLVSWYNEHSVTWLTPLEYVNLRLATKYEVRRARPWRAKGKTHKVGDVFPPDYVFSCINSEWCGPEFEYKVEV